MPNWLPLVVLIACVAGVLIAVFWDLPRIDQEFRAELAAHEERFAERARQRAARAESGPMALYLSSGKVPTGRTAELLIEAQRSHDERGKR